jgi:hypothetical protein
VAAASTRARRGVLVARVVVEVSKGSGPVIGEMAAVWPLFGGRARESARSIGGCVGGRWSQDRAWREIDGRATKGKRMLINGGSQSLAGRRKRQANRFETVNKTRRRVGSMEGEAKSY